jgi:hypothetical protein
MSVVGSVVIVVAVQSCSKTSSDAPPAKAPVEIAEKATAESEAKSESKASIEPGVPNTAPSEVVNVRSDAPLFAIPGTAVRAWSKTQEVGAKRLRAAKIPKEAAAELAALATGLLKKGEPSKGLRLRWVRIIAPAKDDGGAGIAFSFGVPAGDDYPWTDLTFAVALDDGSRYRVFEKAKESSNPEAEVNEWAFSKDRDADGDGVADTMVTYSQEKHDGGIFKSIGFIILASQGSVRAVDVHQEESGLEGDSEDDNYHEQILPHVACWTSLDGRPAFIHITRRHDAIQKKEPIKWATAVWTADAAGVIKNENGRLSKTASKSDKKAWRAIVGENAKATFVGSDLRNSPDCPGNGQAFLAGGALYQLK